MRWCAAERIPPGDVLPVARVLELARLWYADRALESWRPHTPEQADAIFRSLDLDRDFWTLEPAD